MKTKRVIVMFMNIICYVCVSIICLLVCVTVYTICILLYDMIIFIIIHTPKYIQKCPRNLNRILSFFTCFNIDVLVASLVCESVRFGK